MLKSLRLVLPVFISILLFSCASQADEIENVLANAKKDGKSVMLELGSVGCIQCENMKPVMQKLRDAYKGKLEVIFIDVRQENKLARRFGVHLIPTQVFLDRDGNEFHRHIGYYSFEEITPILKKSGL